MSIGEAVRRRLGPLESPAAEAYRSAFIDLGAFAGALVGRVAPRRMLEIGCGDGSTAARLCRVFPAADYVGIDVAPSPGRRFRDDDTTATASFRCTTSAELRSEDPEPFDLVVLVDVLHHIPSDVDRRAVLADAAALSGPGGAIVIKEWSGHRSPGYALAWVADRYVSGDRTVRFSTTRQLRALVAEALPGWGVDWTDTVRPWRANNVVLGLRR